MDVLAQCHQERARWIVWLPVCLAAGALIYLSLPVEPPAYLITALGLAAVVAHRVWRRGYRVWPLAMALLLILLGFGWMQLYTALNPVVMLEREQRISDVTGRIIALSDIAGGYRITLDEVRVEGLAPENTPERVRLKLRGASGEHLLTGQRVAMRAGLLPPTGPVMPGAFDFARYFYFQRIGAVGYALPPVEVIQPAQNHTDFWVVLTRIREAISNRVRAQMSEAEGAVAAALMTGDRAAIPEHVSDAMRDTNLSHILAISGMHMALITGILFFLLRWGLMALPITRYVASPKKLAAMVCLVAGFAYLLLAGLPVSASRAYIMVALVFGAILLDRQVMPMRSLALAALLLLLVNPSYAMQPGFQLSFVATAALIAWYEQIRAQAERWLEPQARIKRAMLYLGGVLMTTLVAELATAPLVLYHFNNISFYGMLANLIIMPIVSFWMMPCVLVALLLMPLGLEFIALAPLEWSVSAMIAIASWVAAMPGAQTFMPAPPGWGMALCMAGLAWLLLWRTRWRLYGIPAMLIGLLSVLSVEPPDLLISADGKQVAGRVEGELHMLKGRAGSFTPEQWANGAGRRELAGIPRDHPAWRCDALGCVYRAEGGQVIAFPESFEAQAEDCRWADLVVSPFYLKPDACEARVIDRQGRIWRGAHWAWLENGEIRMQTTQAIQGKRRWSNENRLH